MNFRISSSSFLMIAFLATPYVHAFTPMKPMSSVPSDGEQLDMTASLQSAEEIATPQNDNNNIVDMASVVAQVEAAIQMASQSVASSFEVENEEGETTVNQNMVATALAGSAIGVVAGSPLVLGAALGVVGSKLLMDDSEEGQKKRKVLAGVKDQLSHQLQGAMEYAQSEVDKEGGDVTKLSEKLLAAVQTRADEWTHDVQSKAGALQKDAKDAPQLMLSNVKATVERDDFQDGLKQAPGRAFSAVKGFLQSDEVKTASGSVWQAVKSTLESDEVQALKSRATKAVQDTMKVQTIAPAEEATEEEEEVF